MAFDNNVCAMCPHGRNKSHTYNKNHSSHLWRKENKYRHSLRHGSSNGIQNPFAADLSVRLEREFGLTGVWKQARRYERLPNKSIKELKAENGGGAGRVKNRMFAEAEKQNEEIKRFEVRVTEFKNVAKWMLARNGQTGLFEKVKEKLFEKDVDRGLELAETLTENCIMINIS